MSDDLQMVFSAEIDDFIRACVERGLSYSLIADHLSLLICRNVSKNSVIGRAYRLGLCQSGGNIREPRITKQNGKPMNKPRELREEAAAIRALLRACDGSSLKSTANYWRFKLERGADRLEEAARVLSKRKATNTSEAAE